MIPKPDDDAIRFLQDALASYMAHPSESFFEHLENASAGLLIDAMGDRSGAAWRVWQFVNDYLAQRHDAVPADDEEADEYGVTSDHE